VSLIYVKARLYWSSTLLYEATSHGSEQFPFSAAAPQLLGWTKRDERLEAVLGNFPPGNWNCLYADRHAYVVIRNYSAQVVFNSALVPHYRAKHASNHVTHMTPFPEEMHTIT
jgi:hypothetical protein